MLLARTLLHGCRGRGHQSEEIYLAQLQEHFSENEAWAQLETVIDWGRYAELFSYVEDRGIFRLEEQETQEERGT